MLQSLNIKNFGLIDELNLDFHESLNILTGQTGAGKSILLEGVRVALGGRFTATQVRDLAKPSLVEAVFDLSRTALAQDPEIQHFILENDAQIIIQRTFDNKGKSRIKINGMTVNVTQLKKIGSLLLDFHGAHDHQMILSEAMHLPMLDRLIDFKDTFQKYTLAYKGYVHLRQEQENLSELNQSREREMDLLAHQIQELEQVSLDEAAYTEVMDKQTKINHAQKFMMHIQEMLEILEVQPNSCLDQVRKLFAPLRQVQQMDPQTEPIMDVLTDFQELGDALSSQLRNYVDGLSFHADEAEGILDEAEIYRSLLRKYGQNMEAVQVFYQEIKEKYTVLNDLEMNQEKLVKQIRVAEKNLKKDATVLTAIRKKQACQLKKIIEKELAELGMEHVRFEVRLSEKNFSTDGADHIVFYISPNAGEDLKPLSEIISSGEAARVMLALKKALIQVDPVPVLIFDEIDAQIGGRLGKITGEKLRDISRFRQVLLITHLPQIASFANHHYKVCKSVKGKRATTDILLLDEDQRIDELAHMMSGSKESDISLRHAEDMLASATLTTFS